jgi:RHS repeat-associated protein
MIGTLQSDEAWITMRNGTVTYPPINSASGLATYTDRNGNQISVNSSGVFTDTLGTTALTVSGLGTASSPMKVAYTSPFPSSVNYQVNYTTYTVATNFGVSTIHEFGATAEPLVSSIVLPDGSQYTFGYEATPSTPSTGACTPLSGTYSTNCVTARLKSIQLPTGGTITYAYTNGNNGIYSDGSAATLTRTTPDGTWTYVQVKNTGAASTTTFTDPQSNQTTVQFQGIYETARQAYQGSTSGTLLQTVNTCYNGATSPCTTAAVTLPITRRTQLVALPNNTGKVCEHDQYFNAYGLQTEQDDYDYGTGAPATPALRKIVTVYNTALTNGIVSMPSSVTTCNGTGTTSACTGPSGSSTGTVVAQTTFSYDQTTPTTSNPVSPQWTSISGSRGNPTTIQTLVTGSTYLNQTNSYYDTGNLYIATDVNGGQTTYSYSGTSCGNAFPTGITEAINTLTQSYTWNCTGGVQLTATDENNQVTSATYNDAYFWRPNALTDQLGNQTYANYQPNPTYCCPPMVEWSLTFNNGNSIASDLQYKDSLGRTYVDQHLQSPGATGSSMLDTVSYTFDTNGRAYSVSMPCAVGFTVPCSTPKTTQTYDALNRPLQTTDGGGGTATNTYSQNDLLVIIGPAPSGENTKRRQLEYDALGRLTSVCEITAGTTAAPAGTCGQNSPQTGYWTKYTYDALGDLLTVTQNAQAASGSQQTRAYTYDALSRLTSQTNPETGTTSYTYDSNSTCGSYAGDQVKRIDNAGNTTCYAYDSLHRLTSQTYTGSGPNIASTPNRYFVYDSATVNTVTMANAKGNLAEAYTTAPGSASTAAKITDLGFSYTVRGQVSDALQMSPNSGGYYHATYAYFENGATKQFGGLPGLPTFTYGLDGEGRVNALSASAVTGQVNQNPLTATIYNSASQPTTVTLGSGDSDAFTYDPNTLRLTQYQFSVNGESFIGKLGWNANSTLGSLNITDPFNTNDTQNCAYAHDDLTRIASVNCGASIWQQNFSYDAFGNLDKTVPSGSAGTAFQPTYNAKNQYATVPGATPSYDADGDVLGDGAHTYTWDAEGHYASIDSYGITYDALGRVVDEAYPFQFFYGVDGLAKIGFQGQTPRRGTLSLPGAGSAVYDAENSGLFFYQHADHLGSARLASTPTRAFDYSLAYAPFGEMYALSSSVQGSFTGQTNVGGLDDYQFPARIMSTQGRWVSPDPAGLAAVDPTNPQSWNRYAYVLNSPLLFVDPQGLVLACTTVAGVQSCTYYPDDQNTLGSPTGGLADGGGGGNPGAPALSCVGFVAASCAPRAPFLPSLSPQGTKPDPCARASRVTNTLLNQGNGVGSATAKQGVPGADWAAYSSMGQLLKQSIEGAVTGRAVLTSATYGAGAKAAYYFGKGVVVQTIANLNAARAYLNERVACGESMDPTNLIPNFSQPPNPNEDN